MLKYNKKKKEKKDDEEEESVVELLNAYIQEPEQRSIMFVGEVNEEKSADLISALLVLSQQKKDDEETNK